ncbi:MAG: ABC transporter permease [Parcubacteria group bacterium]|nr:ABC transporter permease [Parcubacteria group bacterium]
MTLKDSFITALGGLKTHKSRSGLTILGIVIGITAIILMMSIGNGAEQLILNEIGGLGAETIVVRPGKEPTGPSDLGETLFADSLKRKDLEALKRKGNVPYLREIMPALLVPGSVSYEGETYRPTIMGGSFEIMSATFNVYVTKGTAFTETEINQNASVAIIGSKVVQELFGGGDAVGEFIKIKDRKFRVIGVLEPKGQAAFFNFDEIVIVPYTTAQLYLLGIDYFHEIIIKTEGPEFVARSVADIERTLRESHSIENSKDDDFFLVTQQGVVKQVQTILGALTAFLSSVVAIALVVGGIGVMNIMLVSVTERTKEIGLRKAIGATEKDILRQFLFEAVILTAFGGIIGIVLGGVLSLLASILLTQVLELKWVFSFPLMAVFLGISMSAVVGLIFGIYPARIAARKSPIEALRYE